MTKQTAKFVPDNFGALLLGVGELVPTGAHGRAVLAELCQWLNDHPRVVQARHDAALFGLSSFYGGSERDRAIEMEKELGRYAASAAGKRELKNGSNPYTKGTPNYWRCEVLRASRESGPVGWSRIRQILASDCKNSNILARIEIISLGHDLPQDSTRPKNRKGETNMRPNPSTTEKFIETFSRTPAAQEIISSARKATIADRQKILDQIDALDKKDERDRPKLESALRDAIAARDKVQRALEEANKVVSREYYAKYGAGVEFSSARERLVIALRDSGESDLIDAFQSEMWDDVEKTRKLYECVNEQRTDRVTRESYRYAYSNIKSIEARIAAVRAAIDAADALRLVADQSDMATRLQKMRDELPKVDPARDPEEKRDR